ncbi:MAG: hypothetical protein N2510_06865 [Ignavibacteria bacterium]|nr:hypothetical protein [Ignavibacteria bacterium]
MLKTIIILAILSTISYSQFDKPIIRIGLGVSEPFDELKGKDYLMYSSYRGIQLALIDTNLYKTNYAAQTGINFFGAVKINFDKYNIVRGSGFLGFTSFNTFQSKKKGNQIYLNPNDSNDYFTPPQDYNYSFSAFSFGFGLELAPTSFTKVFSPYFGANVSFNSFTSTLERSPSTYDTVRFKTTGFRIGANFDAGLEYKFSNVFGMALGVKYDLGNLLLKESSGGSTADFYEWGRQNANLNDEEGVFRSSLPNYLSNNFPKQYTANKKKINWGTVYLAVNIYLNTKTKKTPKK